MDHGGMEHGGQCNMNMLFTWDTTNLCIVFEGWRVNGTASLIWSLLGVILLTAGYELVREASRRYEAGLQRKVKAADLNAAMEPDAHERSSLLYPGRNVRESQRNSRVIKAVLYAVQVFYSFFIMLLFMTYNGWIMLAVAVGAFVGYLAFGQDSATKSVACH